MKLTIRKMTLEDIPAIIDLDQKSFSLPWPERSFRFEVTDNPASRCWVAELDGKVVGMIVVWLLVDEAHVATLATHPDFRRQGVAKRLLSHALLHLIEEGAQSSFLEVRESNLAAREMYRKFGYEEAGRRRRYYRDNDEDAILMNLNSLKAERLSFGDERSPSNQEEQNER
ncbi:MAG TPA: ribosomal protein S18-alanine N-acetyltransferase [Anaerolineales bacterium]|nr:ribosomal protein S18-alanine N-acetyltransferase [Anaerolineales bacterium]